MGAAFNPWGFSLSMKCAGNVKCARGNGYARGGYFTHSPSRTTRIIPLFFIDWRFPFRTIRPLFPPDSMPLTPEQQQAFASEAFDVRAHKMILTTAQQTPEQLNGDLHQWEQLYVDRREAFRVRLYEALEDPAVTDDELEATLEKFGDILWEQAA